MREQTYVPDDGFVRVLPDACRKYSGKLVGHQYQSKDFLEDPPYYYFGVRSMWFPDCGR